MKKMKLSDIKISETFANSVPSEEKMNECRNNWITYGKQDRFVVVNHDNVLVDGYVMYLVLMEHKEEYAEVKISHCKKKRWHRKNTKDWLVPRYKDNPTTYIYGTHPNSKDTKEYCWRVPASWGNWAENIEIGDTVLCQTKFGFSPVVVTRVEVLDTPPVEIRVKRVAKREIRRNGLMIEV